jgi:hypothetical protein
MTEYENRIRLLVLCEAYGEIGEEIPRVNEIMTRALEDLDFRVWAVTHPLLEEAKMEAKKLGEIDLHTEQPFPLPTPPRGPASR